MVICTCCKYWWRKSGLQPHRQKQRSKSKSDSRRGMTQYLPLIKSHPGQEARLVKTALVTTESQHKPQPVPPFMIHIRVMFTGNNTQRVLCLCGGKYKNLRCFVKYKSLWPFCCEGTLASSALIMCS